MDKRAPWRVVIKPGCGEHENTPNSSEILPRLILFPCTSNNENVLQNNCFQERTQKPLGTSKSTPPNGARLHVKKTSYNSHEMLTRWQHPPIFEVFISLNISHHLQLLVQQFFWTALWQSLWSSYLASFLVGTIRNPPSKLFLTSL